jgi:hypothetical protein
MAAAVISATPGTMQLRQLQSMVEVSAEKNSTLIFPIPIELMEFARGAFGHRESTAAAPKPIEGEVLKVKDVTAEKMPL